MDSHFILERGTKLYRVRTIYEEFPHDFSYECWLVDEPLDIFWILNYRKFQHPEKEYRELINLPVDIYIIEESINLFYFDNFNYDPIQKYIKTKNSSYKIKKYNKEFEYNETNNLEIAKYLNNNIDKIDIEGWYEKGVPKTGDKQSIENINEIMLLSNSKDKLKYLDTLTIDTILTSIL